MAGILITNAYSARNKGDAAIIEAMVRDLRRRPSFADAEITISSAAGPDEEGYPEAVIHSFTSLKNGLAKSPLLQQLGFLLLIYPQTLLWVAGRCFLGLDLPVWSRLRGLLRAYDAADLVLAAGGGYLYTRTPWRGSIILLSVIYGYHCAALLGKPVYLYSQSVGPFAGRFQQWLVRRSLCGVRLVFAREEQTRRRLDRLATGWKMPAVHSAADAAFLLDDATAPCGLPPRTDDSLRVGLTVRRWFPDGDAQADYEEQVARFVRQLAEEANAEIWFLPQVTYGAAGDDDRRAARRVRTAAGDSPRLHLVEQELSPSEIRGFCGAMDLFVGTRMHSNIFALTVGVPALAVGYQPKTAGIMAQLGLERFVLPIEQLTAEGLRERFNQLLDERDEVAAALQTGIPLLRENARRAARLIEEDFSLLGRRD